MPFSDFTKVSKTTTKDDQAVIKGSPSMGAYGYMLKVDLMPSKDGIPMEITGKITLRLMGILAGLVALGALVLGMAKPNEFILGLILVPMVLLSLKQEQKRVVKLVEAAVNDLKKEFKLTLPKTMAWEDMNFYILFDHIEIYSVTLNFSCLRKRQRGMTC